MNRPGVEFILPWSTNPNFFHWHQPYSHINYTHCCWKNRGNHYLCSWSFYQSSQSPGVSFYSSQTSLLFHHCRLEQQIADYNQRALLASRVFQWCSLSQPLGDIRIPCKLGPVCIWGPLLPSGGSLLLQPPFPSCWQIRTWLGYRWFQEVPLSQQDLHPPHQLPGLLVPEPHTCCRRYQEAPTTWVFILVPKWSGLVSPNFYTLSWAVTGWRIILSWNISPTSFILACKVWFNFFF